MKELQNAVYNHRFTKARKYAKGKHGDLLDVLDALSNLVGDSGHLLEGDLFDIIDYVSVKLNEDIEKLEI